MTPLEQHIIALQQHIDQLATEMSTLKALASTDQINSTEPVADKPSHQPRKQASAIGINRYRQMHEL